jgi:RHS repeat-associated protein
VATDGSVYIADQNNRRVRRVAPDGTISTVVFNGAFLSSPPSVPPPTLATSVPAIGLIAKVRVGPDGSLYTVETGGNGGVVRRVTPDGLIGPFAGNLAFGFGGDGGPATAATFQHPGDAAVAPDGSVYINDGNNCTREVTPDGLIRTAAGVPGNNGRSSGNDVPATAALIGTSSVRVAPDGTLYVGDGAGGRICKVGPPLAGFSDNISGFTFPSTDGTQVYNFDPNGRHLTTVDAFTGATLYSFAYDSAGRLSTVTDVNGDVTHVSRDGSGNLSSIVGPFGETTTFTPDPNGYMASATDPAGLGTQFSYDSGGLMQMMTDARGGLHQFGYDGLGRLAEDQDPAGGSKVLAETVGNNEFTTTVTTALGQQTTYVTQNGSTGSFGRANTLPTGLQSSLQFGTNYSTATAVPDGTTTSETDSADPRFGMLSPVPSVTTTLPSGLTSIRSTSRAFTLGAGGTLATFTEKTTLNGNAWTRAFSVGPPITWTATSPVGRVTKTTADPAGRPLQISINATPPVTPLSFAYDSHGRLQQVTQGTRIWTTGYDTNGYANSQTDPLNQTVTTANDPDGRPLLTTLQDQREVGTTWDGDSNMSSITLPGGLATQPDPTREHQFSYTPVDLTQTYTPPAIATGLPSTTYAYNADRFLQTITRPDSVVVTHVPDAFERLSQIVYPQGTLAYAYNPSTGLLQSTTTPGGETTTFGFDGFLPKSITWSGPVAGSITFGYNLDFRVNAQSLNGGPALPFAYDNDDLLTCAGAAACPAAGALTITPDPQNGRLSATAFGNVTDAYAYDTNGLLTTYAAAFSGNPVYVETILSRDANGRIHEKIDALSGITHDWVYSYDRAGRLTDVTEDGNFESHYAYDGDDNRTSFTNTSGTVNPTYDVQDRLSTYGPASYAYTANGELTSKTVAGQTTSYIYDALGNLLHVGFASALPDGTTTVDYVVDGQNRRVGRKVNGTLVQGWLYQDPLRPVAQLDGSNNVVARFVYGSKTNVPDYMVTSGGTYRILSDHLGSPRLVVDTSSGNVIETINYDEFGSENDALAASLPAGYQRIPFAFAGGLQDPDTGLVRFGARDYDASVGRWTSKDPTRFDGGSMNLYGYVLNDPVDIFDPNGTDVAGWFCQHLGWFCGPQCVEPDCLPGPPPGPSPPPDPVMYGAKRWMSAVSRPPARRRAHGAESTRVPQRACSLLRVPPRPPSGLHLPLGEAGPVPLKRRSLLDVNRTAEALQEPSLFLGFDARPAPSELKDRWPSARKREALLRLDVPVPLSVDYLIWPSAWDLGDKTLGWRGPIQGLWDNMAALEGRLESMPGRWWIIAVALDWRSVPPDERAEWQERVTGIKVGAEVNDWKPLGYDVADRFLTSSALWFRPGENVQTLRTEWSQRLNKHHLFSKFDPALQFRELSNLRVPEHAPHFVYRLFFGGQRNVGKV